MAKVIVTIQATENGQDIAEAPKDIVWCKSDDWCQINLAFAQCLAAAAETPEPDNWFDTRTVAIRVEI